MGRRSQFFWCVAALLGTACYDGAGTRPFGAYASGSGTDAAGILSGDSGETGGGPSETSGHGSDGGASGEDGAETGGEDSILDDALHLSPAGEDCEACGSRERPFRTFAYALPRLVPGDILIAHAGDYREDVIPESWSYTPASPDAPIVVTAAPGEPRPIIRGRLFVRDADYWVFDGLRVTYDPEVFADPGKSILQFWGGIGWRFQNGEAWGAHSVATASIGGSPRDWHFVGNCIHDTVPTNGADMDHNLYVNYRDDGEGGIIERNVFFGATNGTNIKVGAGRQELPDPRGLTIRYNTFDDAGYNIRIVYSSRDVKLFRNIFARPTKAWPEATQHIQGYRTDGSGNRAFENAAFGGQRFLTHWVPQSTIAASGNVTGTDPEFTSTGCDGFVPAAPALAGHGRHAGLEQVVAGDWDGDGRDDPGVVADDSTWFLRDRRLGSASDHIFRFGSGGDRAVVGRFVGDSPSAAVYRPETRTWHFDALDLTLTWGTRDDVPFAGDWNGDGRDELGLYRPATGDVFVIDELGPDFAASECALAIPHGTPIAGDWDGDGRDDIGIVSGSTVHLARLCEPPHEQFQLPAADHYVAGDWDGDGRDELGTVTGKRWHLYDRDRANSTVVVYDGTAG